MTYWLLTTSFFAITAATFAVAVYYRGKYQIKHWQSRYTAVQIRVNELENDLYKQTAKANAAKRRHDDLAKEYHDLLGKKQQTIAGQPIGPQVIRLEEIMRRLNNKG